MGERDDERIGVLTDVYRTVSPAYRARPDAEMDAAGWPVFLVMLALFLSIPPIVVGAVSKAVETVAGHDYATPRRSNG